MSDSKDKVRINALIAEIKARSEDEYEKLMSAFNKLEPYLFCYFEYNFIGVHLTEFDGLSVDYAYGVWCAGMKEAV